MEGQPPTPAGPTLREQTLQTLENVRSVLEAGGAGWDDVMMIRVYLTDTAHFAEMNGIYNTYFEEQGLKEAPAARTTVYVGLAGRAADRDRRPRRSGLSRRKTRLPRPPGLPGLPGLPGPAGPAGLPGLRRPAGHAGGAPPGGGAPPSHVRYEQYWASLPIERYMQSAFSSSWSTASLLRAVSRSITSSGG